MRMILILAALGAAVAAQAEGPPPGATACTGCHGAAGLDLSSLTANQIETALAQFRDGSRPATLMDRIAKGFTPDESAAIAAWLASDGAGD